MMSILESYMKTPLIAILRGVQEDEVVEITGTLIDQGFTMIEVPLNSPKAISSIQRISDAFGDRALVGAGTVLSVEEVDAVASAGGKLMLSPNTNLDVVRRAKALGMVAIPGVATPTELLAAISAGADAAKAFPAEMLPPSVIKSWRSVIPSDFPILAVGGIHAGNMSEYTRCGVSGFGIGSNLYRSGKSLKAIVEDAGKFIQSVSEY